MKNLSLFSIPAIVFLLGFTSCTENSGEQIDTNGTESEYTVLVFSKTEGFRHDSIEQGVAAVKSLGEENGFGVIATENSDEFTFENLTRYDAVVFLNTTGNVLNEEQQSSFEKYIQQGGGFAGTHSATDTEYDWPWYGELVGAYFDNHPGNPNVRDAVVNVVDSEHISTTMLPEQWEHTDEWYNFGYRNDNVNVLLQLDTESYEGSDHPGDHSIAWYHNYDGGRAFYTGLGHTKESFSNPLYLEHLLGGITYAMGI